MLLGMIDLTTNLTWLVMLGNVVVIILFTISIPTLPMSLQRRAKLGMFIMALVVTVVSGSLFFLASRAPTLGSQLSKYVFPLASCILLASVYRLTFPPLIFSPTPQRLQPPRLLLFLLTMGAGVGLCGLLLLDLFFA